MRTGQKFAATVLIVALGGAVYGIVLLGHSSIVSAKKKAAAAQVALVDQTPFRTAQELAQLADTREEQDLAKEALRLSDYETDLSFNIALQDAEAHPPQLSAEAKTIEVRLKKAEKLRQAMQAQVDELKAETNKANGSKKEDLQNQLDLASANLDVASNDVDDARRDQFPERAPDELGLVHRVEQWLALNKKQARLESARADAQALISTLTSQRNALAAQIETEKRQSPDLAAHSRQTDATNAVASAETAVTAATQSVRKSRSTSEAKAAVATTKALTADQRNLASLDKRIDDEKQLAANYGEWLDFVSDRQRMALRRILFGTAIVLAITLVGLFFNTWLEKLLGKSSLDQRQMQTLRATARVSVQVLAVLLILLVIFGPPSNLGTFVGLATAGLTVALKDFIVGFLGWFVLMRKNGIRLGDWVEINGVTGEVIEIGLFHTVLLETGNWTDSGHPTGRRVTFTNSYAIEGHYFNFSTSGQWLWDELQVVLPTGEDPYPLIDAIQKRVLEATHENAKAAAVELKAPLEIAI